MQSTKNEPSLTENPVRNILSEKGSPQIQDLLTVTKNLQQDTKSFLDQMSSITTNQYHKHCEGKSTAEGTHVSSNYVPTNSFSDNAQDASTISTSSSEVPSKPVSSNAIISINKISCLYNNCDSLLSKIDELKIRLFDKNILISGITEIMSKNCLIKPDENDFKIEGYNLYTNIKDFPDGRRTGLHIHKLITAKESTVSFNKGYLESCGQRFIFQKQKYYCVE